MLKTNRVAIHIAQNLLIKIFNNLAQRKSIKQKTVIAFKIDILCKE